MASLYHLFLILSSICCSAAAAAAEPQIGINYGQVADNLPSPEKVVPLLHSLGIRRVKLYDADPRVLRAFSGTDIEFVVGLPDEYLPRAAKDPSLALSWVKSSIQPFVPKTKISAITIGNEVLSGDDTSQINSLLPAMQAVHSALSSLNLDRHIAVTTAHSLSVLSASYPPSAAAFRRDLIPVVTPLLAFLANTSSPFLINAYPYFAYKADPKRVRLEYVLFQSNPGVVDPVSGLRYENMLHAQVDAARAAIAAAGGKGVEVMVSETGWPSAGDEDEAGATPENAKRYNGNLLRMVAEGKGTPMSPGSPLGVYVFALFNENMKPGPASERNYGLFKPDGSPAYQIARVGNSTAGGGGAGAGAGVADSPVQSASGATSSTNYYTISSATGRRSSWAARWAAAAAGAAAVLALVGLHLVS